jgi:hypothetical protein
MFKFKWMICIRIETHSNGKQLHHNNYECLGNGTPCLQNGNILIQNVEERHNASSRVIEIEWKVTCSK